MLAAIFLQDDELRVVRPGIPSPSREQMHDIAQQAVPEGIPYRIIDHSDLPTDYTYREAWTADFSVADGYGLGPQMYAIKKQKEQQA